MTYNCEEHAIIIPITEEPDITVTTLYVTSSCCGTPTPYVYCNIDNKPDLLDCNLTVDNLLQIKEEPEFLCYAEMTWDEQINVTLTDVVSFTGTKETYISGVLITTDNLDLTYFNTIHSVYTIFSEADRNYIFNLEFTLANGQIITYVISYNTNVYYNDTAICGITDFSKYKSFDYACENYLTIEEDGIHFPITLVDGFYSASWTSIEGCFLVECDETLACKVKNFINEKFNKNCYRCNKKKDLEIYMKLLMYYNAFISGCMSCCDKCSLYEKIIKVIEGCKDC